MSKAIDEDLAHAARFLDEEDFTYLRLDWISDDPPMLAISHRLSERWKDTVTPLRRSKRDMATAFNVVLTAIEVCSGYAREWLRIPIYDAIYTGATQRSPAFNRDILDALKWLIAEPFLQLADGRRVIQKKSHDQLYLPMAYELTHRWRSEISPTPISARKYIRRNPLSNYIQVRKTIRKGKRKLKVQVQPSAAKRHEHNEMIKATEQMLTAYDKLMNDTVIKLGNDLIPSYQTTLTRIFSNGRYQEGGRFYGYMQGRKKAERRSLTFDGQAVLEMDYTAIHPTILYELEGLSPLNDPYSIEGFERDDVKVAFNILINRKGHQKGDAAAVASNLEIGISQATRLCNALYTLHEPIKHRFNTGYGLELQRIDSDVMEQVLSTFVTRKKPIIPVHDSALVRVADEELLFLAMRDAYCDVLQLKIPERTFNKVLDADESRYVMEPFTVAGKGVGIKTEGVDEDIDQIIVNQLS